MFLSWASGPWKMLVVWKSCESHGIWCWFWSLVSGPLSGTLEDWGRLWAPGKLAEGKRRATVILVLLMPLYDHGLWPLYWGYGGRSCPGWSSPLGQAEYLDPQAGQGKAILDILSTMSWLFLQKERARSLWFHCDPQFDHVSSPFNAPGHDSASPSRIQVLLPSLTFCVGINLIWANKVATLLPLQCWDKPLFGLCEIEASRAPQI